MGSPSSGSSWELLTRSSSSDMSLTSGSSTPTKENMLKNRSQPLVLNLNKIFINGHNNVNTRYIMSQESMSRCPVKVMTKRNGLLALIVLVSVVLISSSSIMSSHLKFSSRYNNLFNHDSNQSIDRYMDINISSVRSQMMSFDQLFQNSFRDTFNIKSLTDVIVFLHIQKTGN